MGRFGFLFPEFEKATGAPIVATSTTKPAPILVTKEKVVNNHAHVNHFHVNQAVYHEEKAEQSRQTVGAVWALTLGILSPHRLDYYDPIIFPYKNTLNYHFSEH